MSSPMLDKLVKEGLPAWFYTWRTVAAITLVGPFAVMAAKDVASWTIGMVVGPSTHAPACYTMQYADPLSPGTRFFDLKNEDAVKLRVEREELVREVITAIHACQPGACTETQSKFYQATAKAYMSGRGRAAQRMFVRYGDAGRAYAEAQYDTSEDVAVIRALRHGFNAGLLDISRLHSDEAVARMLLFKPLSELQLCRSTSGKICEPGRLSC